MRNSSLQHNRTAELSNRRAASDLGSGLVFLNALGDVYFLDCLQSCWFHHKKSPSFCRYISKLSASLHTLSLSTFLYSAPYTAKVTRIPGQMCPGCRLGFKRQKRLRSKKLQFRFLKQSLPFHKRFPHRSHFSLELYQHH